MDMVNRGEMMSIDDVNDILQLNVIGAVPDDENIVVATNKGQPLVGDDSLAGQAYMNICRRITGEEIPFLDLNGKGGFFKKLSSLLRVIRRINMYYNKSHMAYSGGIKYGIT